MFNAFVRLFQSPDDHQPEFIRLARNILIFTLLANTAAILITAGSLGPNEPPVTPIALGFTGVLELLALFLTLRGQVWLGKIIVPSALIIAICLIAVSAHGIHDISVTALPVIVIIGFLLQGKRALGLTTPLAMIAIIAIGLYDMSGLNDSPVAGRTGVDDLAIAIVLLLAASATIHQIMERLNNAIITARTNEQAQITANMELRGLQATLEKRISDRTAAVEESAMQIQKRAAQLEAISDVSRSIASIQNIEQLLPSITRFISERFGFYHVGIFLLDEAREFAILRAANSEGGKKMLQRDHKLKVESSSLVGYTASRSRPRIALDVGADAVFFNNPDLPETRSEITLPLITGEQVTGVLDVQSTEPSAFSQEDALVLSALANQIAIALENARLFAETQQALTESERTSNQYVASGWRQAAQKTAHIGYESYAPGKVAPLEQPLQIQVQTTVPGGRAMTKSDASAGLLSVPIRVRGEVIGVLHVSAEETNRNWSVDELTLVNAVAERAALALENARLMDDAQRRAAKERLIGEIANKVASAGSIENILQTAARELSMAMSSSAVSIQFNESRK